MTGNRGEDDGVSVRAAIVEDSPKGSICGPGIILLFSLLLVAHRRRR